MLGLAWHTYTHTCIHTYCSYALCCLCPLQLLAHYVLGLYICCCIHEFILAFTILGPSFGLFLLLGSLAFIVTAWLFGLFFCLALWPFFCCLALRPLWLGSASVHIAGLEPPQLESAYKFFSIFTKCCNCIWPGAFAHTGHLQVNWHLQHQSSQSWVSNKPNMCKLARNCQKYTMVVILAFLNYFIWYCNGASVPTCHEWGCEWHDLGCRTENYKNAINKLKLFVNLNLGPAQFL